MQLENSFTVPVPIDEAWRVLLDIERIAPCMPGAALDSVTGDDFTGRVKVKLGPINLTYQGKASFVEKDEAAHRAVIDARGKDQRGNGTAAAVVTATLAAEGDVTRVDVLTDLNITGRPAQFGRGVMTDVGNKLLGQFADKLAAQLGEGDAQGDAERSAAAKAASTVTGVVEEVAASVEQTPGDNAAAETARKAGTAAKKTAAAATDAAGGGGKAPAKKAPAKKAALAATDQAPAATDTAPAATDTAPAATGGEPAGTPVAADSPPSDATLADRVPGASDVPARPSSPPSAPKAPPTRPATGGPAKSSPATMRPPVAEPEPIDLLEVAGGAALTRYAKPLAGVAAVLFVITLVVRRRRRR
ncbi:SRPBCC family protein [Blastococcus sp. TF02A-26]|uniref:SRPBCC family protein n=1 Tax=Blastococcus sp. TF02A-26 TaxID=2250577 RepID=UPI000DE9CEE3|nr:SRPBCC family protein [Blastococcus sp. TF02A-26]RBY79976.1 carbon monoxide dehydrogenase [Blastococcus sp. TF02A-26]